jgi:glycosyltransferase involved in cell wall biosynthesis
MTIGIDASRAFQKNKTGIEEYSFQVIKHLSDKLEKDQVVLYCNPAINTKPDFKLPENWKVKFLRAPIFWTQIRLSLEMLFHPVDVLFVPAHTVPLIHPKNTVVTIHGLEYEFCPGAYSLFERLYMRWSIRKSCQWAKKIIAVSENTKKDLTRLYKVPKEKTEVIYEGIGEINFKFQISNFKSNPNDKISNYKKYFLFVGRLEDRKNIEGIVEAFEIAKKKYDISHKLILVGKFGYGGEKIKERVYASEFKNDIIMTGYVSDDNKHYLLANADVFLFPTFYEGFGLPILEAQSVGTPVVTSNISSMPEVAGDSAVLVDPKDANAIAEAVHKLISDESWKNDIIEKGLENVKRFSWEKCAREVSSLLRN